VSANVEQKARLLEVKVVENTETVAQLRQERALLTSGQRDLQRQLVEVSEVHLSRCCLNPRSYPTGQTLGKLRREQASSQAAHDAHREQLDAQTGELAALRRALEHAHAARDGARADAAGVHVLEADLARVRADAEQFGHDLARLRGERDRFADAAERARVSEQAAKIELEALESEADKLREDARRARRSLEGHVCAA
jgi:chromosome segregation ATPase